MNLKPQTVYIPVDKQKIKEVPLFYVSEFRNKDWNYLSHTEKKENQICLSKEELVELLGKVFDGGFNESGEGWNAKYPTDYKNRKEQIINNLFNQ